MDAWSGLLLCRSGFFGRNQPIAHAAYRLDIMGLAGFNAQLLTQIEDVCADNLARFVPRTGVPTGRLHQFNVVQHHARHPHEFQQQPKFSWRKVQWLVTQPGAIGSGPTEAV